MSGEKPHVEHIISGLDAYIERSSNVLEKGDYIELQELSEMVQNLCSCINDMPVDDARNYADKLDVMVERLNVLQDMMQSHQHEVKAQLNTLAENRQAAGAYAKVNALNTGSAPADSQEDE